jgi:predicted RNA-binding protein
MKLYERIMLESSEAISLVDEAISNLQAKRWKETASSLFKLKGAILAQKTRRREPTNQDTVFNAVVRPAGWPSAMEAMSAKPEEIPALVELGIEYITASLNKIGELIRAGDFKHAGAALSLIANHELSTLRYLVDDSTYRWAPTRAQRYRDRVNAQSPR